MKDGSAEVPAHVVLGRARCDCPSCRLEFDELEPDEPVRVRITSGFLRRHPAFAEGLAEALGRPVRPVLPRQLELFEATAALDVDGRPVDVGQLVTLHPEGDLGVLVAVTACHPQGRPTWYRVEVELEDVVDVRGAHQVRGA